MMLAMPSAMLVGGGLLALGLLVLLVALVRRRGPTTDDLGPISQQWIVQHKARSRDSAFWS
jgi:hypothetical protein